MNSAIPTEFPISRGLYNEICTLCRRYHVVPLRCDTHSLTIASSQDDNAALLTSLRFLANREILIEKWPPAKLEEALSLNSGMQKDPLTTVKKEGSPPSSITPKQEEEHDVPVIAFINEMFRVAIQRRASDIHLEPVNTGIRIRLRIDGVLQNYLAPDSVFAAQIITRIKIMGQLNISERRLPQDGQLNVHISQQNYSLRIASLPVLQGEKIVLRILQRQQPVDLTSSGMSDALQQAYLHALNSPQGLILVTGPTGSGKTVTLYNGLRHLNTEQRNICSAEDPVEIPLDGINQTPVNLKIPLDFSQILRSLLRQDPDVIMIGEIRDNETAEIAIKAAQTGHLVLSTLHTNSTSETLDRLVQMKIEPYLLAASLKLIIAQRLVRRLCIHCRTQVVEPEILPTHWWHEPLFHWKSRGCEHCFSGYYGRIGVYEILTVTPIIQQALLAQSSSEHLAQLARAQGDISLLKAGLTLVTAGITSLSEIYRIIGTETQVMPVSNIPTHPNPAA